MPPFRYNAYQDPYVGDITSLMGQPSAIQAQSVREIGNVRAQEARDKGAATAQMIGSLGEITQQGYAGYRKEKADRIHQKLLEEISTEALAYVGEDRVRDPEMLGAGTSWSQGASWGERDARGDVITRTREQVLGSRPEKPAPAPSDTPLPMPDRETEPFAGRLEEMVGPTDTGERFFMTPARNVIPDASVEEPDEALQLDMVRPDGTRKGEGYFGPMRHSDGRWSTEISIADSDNPLLINEDGSRMDYPALVPTLTKEEITWLLEQPLDGPWRSDPRGQAIAQKAEAHAIQRREAGLSVFATPEDAPIGTVSIGDLERYSEIVPEQADRGKMFSMTPAQPFRDSTEAKLPAEKAAPAPETMGEMLAPTVVPTVQRGQGEPPPLYRYLTDGNLRDVAKLSRAMAEEGVGADQIRRIVAEDTAHNQSVTTFNEEDRARGMRETAIRQENLLAHVLELNPEPSAELRERFINIFGPTDGIAKFKTYTEGAKALADLESGNFENMQGKLNMLVGLLELSESPSMRQQVYDQIISTFEGAGIEVPQEIKEMPADPEVLRGVFARTFPEEPEATFAAQELKLEHAVDNARTPEERKIAEAAYARFIKGDIARHDRRRAPLGEGKDPVPPVAVTVMLIEAEEEYDDAIAEIEEAEVTGRLWDGFDYIDFSKDEAQRRRKVATDKLERVKQRLSRWIPIEDTADKWRPPLVAPNQAPGVPVPPAPPVPPRSQGTTKDPGGFFLDEGQ